MNCRNNSATLLRRTSRWCKAALFGAAFALIGTQANAQNVNVSGATVGNGTYLTLGAAFTAINGGVQGGGDNILVDIAASTTEAGPAVLNTNTWGTLTIRPSATATIGGSATAAAGRGVIELNGADNVTINGDIAGGSVGRDLTVTNNNPTATSNTSAIRVATGTGNLTADNVAISNCVLNGSATGRNGASFTSTTSAENNTFGVVVGPNAGVPPAAPTALTSVTGTMVATATANAFSITNCTVTACARGILFLGGAVANSNGVTITNNLVGDQSALAGAPPYTTPATTVYTKGIYVQGTTAVTITGNSVRNILSYVGTQANGIELNTAIGTGVVNVSNNTVIGVVLNAGTSTPRGIDLNSAAAGATVSVNGNTVTNVQSNAPSGFSPKPVGLRLSTSATAATVNGNTISMIYNRAPGTGGVFGIDLAGGNNVTLTNNCVSDVNQNIAGGAAFSLGFGMIGIRVNSGTGHAVYHNTVSMSGAVLTGAGTSVLATCFGILGTGQTGINVRNNLFSNTMSGFAATSAAVCVWLPQSGTSAMNLTLNNNGYFTGSTGGLHGVAHVNTTYLATPAGAATYAGLYAAADFNPALTTPNANFRAYSSVLSAAGTNDNASFASTLSAPLSGCGVDLGSGQAALVNGTGANGTGVALDRDGDSRGTPPDIGADEFILLTCSGADGGTITPATASACAGGTYVMTSTGANSGAGITNQWRFSTTPGGPYSPVVGGSGATSTSYTTGALSAGTYYYVLTNTCSVGPVSDDSNELTLTVNPQPTASAGNNGPACVGGSVNLSGTTDIGTTYSWTGPNGFTSTLEDPTVSPLVAASAGTYTFTATAAGCTSLPATTTVTVNLAPVITATTANPNPTCFNGNSQLQVNIASGTYCASTHSSGSCGFSEGDKILLVTLDGTPALNNPSGCVVAPGYTDFTGLTPSGLTAGGSYNLSVSLGPDGTQFAAAWIDYNQDNDFTDAGEFLGAAAVNLGVSGVWNLPFVADAGAFNGNTRLRVIGGNDAIILSTQSCGASSSAFGETEDYTVTISGGTDKYTYLWNPTTFIVGQETTPNPLATAVNVASQPYTVTVTSGGCSTTGTVTVTTTAPITEATISGTLSYCAGGSTTLTAVPSDGAGPFTYAWTGPSGPEGTAVTQAADEPGIWSVIVSDACGGTAPSVGVTVVENALPTVTITPVPANAAICGGVGNVQMTAVGASTYTWLPVTGLDNAAIANPTSTATSTTTYTVTGTDGNGCTDTATQTVNIGPNPTMGAVTATPPSICSGDDSQLQAAATLSGYTIGAGGTSFIDISGTGTIIPAPALGDDSEHNLTIPSFTFNGVAYTSARVGNNGAIVLGSAAGEITHLNATLPAAIAAGNVYLAPWWDDLDVVAATTQIYTQQIGNIFYIQYDKMDHDTGNPGTDFVTFQVQLNLTTGAIYFVYNDVLSINATLNAGISATVGIQWANSAGNFVQYSANTASLSNGQVISFTPNQPTYSWLPVTFLDDATIADPLAQAVNTFPMTYTVTATSPIGCTSTATVTITEDVTDVDGDGILDCVDLCIPEFGTVGSYCDVNGPLPGFFLGQLDGSCDCIAVACTETVSLDMRAGTAGASEEIGWEILDQNTALVICAGGTEDVPYSTGITAPIVETCCLPAGCFRLRVYDSGGDGFITGGGYQLRETFGQQRRIIENTGNFTTGTTSAIANTHDNGAFCVPIGDVKPIFSSCDKVDWTNYRFLVVSADAAVSATYDVTPPIVQPTNSGYEYWFYNPNGTYSYRRFISHASPDPGAPGTGANRAAHFKINRFVPQPPGNQSTNQEIPYNELLNVRVRGRVNGVNQAFGPACFFKIDAALAYCPAVSLQDDPANADYSCNVTRVFGGVNSSANRIVAKPPYGPAMTPPAPNVRYQFRFRIPGELGQPYGCITRPMQTSPTLYMNWTTGQKLKCSATYEVDVRVSRDGGATWCTDSPTPVCNGGGYQAWGKICTVTITPNAFCQALTGGNNNLALEGNGGLTMYPNPNRGDQLFINLSTVETEVNTVSVDIFDLSGKKVTTRAIPVQDGTINTALDLNGSLAGGMYLVNITAGTKVYTERLVIQP
ncbi:MAG TPA: GEVED domain-containing protein [Flavobacteriales bacterium]|nr:GEVED domain-containing protein [Flavobacteriales bacterium]